jgi:serine/threonine protein phosphatase PrpC
MKFIGLSDIGPCRKNNEDVWIALPEIGFYAIADGMGGHRAGEVAAKQTIDFLSESLSNTSSTQPIDKMIDLRHAIENANTHVYQLSKQSKSFKGMGTTLCCLLILDDSVIYAHVGDSRVYRLREKKLELLTQDHSLYTKWLSLGNVLEKSQTNFPYKNVITRAIGTHKNVIPEITLSQRIPGDIFFLCSDGLSDVLTNQEIETIILTSLDLETAAHSLIQEAKIKGSSDNITILIMESDKKDAKDLFRQQFNDITGSKSDPSYVTRT